MDIFFENLKSFPNYFLVLLEKRSAWKLRDNNYISTDIDFPEKRELNKAKFPGTQNYNLMKLRDAFYREWAKITIINSQS